MSTMLSTHNISVNCLMYEHFQDTKAQSFFFFLQTSLTRSLFLSLEFLACSLSVTRIVIIRVRIVKYLRKVDFDSKIINKQANNKASAHIRKLLPAKDRKNREL